MRSRRPRDISKAQFEKKLAQYGFERMEFSWMGYVKDTETGVHICPLNAGDNRRAQLVYLLEQRKRHQRRQNSE